MEAAQRKTKLAQDPKSKQKLEAQEKKAKDAYQKLLDKYNAKQEKKDQKHSPKD